MHQNRGINRTFVPIIVRVGLTLPVFPSVYYQHRIIRRTTPGQNRYAMTFQELNLIEPLKRAVAEKRLHDPHPDPAAGHPARTRRPRPAGLRPDRDGQDGGLHAADPPAALGRAAHQRATHDQDAGAHADARTGDPDRRMLPRLCPLHGHPPLRDLRRRQPAAAGRCAATRHRPAGSHAGTPARPDRPGLRLAVRHPLFSSSTKPTECSTWVSSTTSGESSRCCPQSGRRSSSRRRCPTTS